MNGRTAKLLSRYASKTGERPRRLKRDWQAATRSEKAKRRTRMKAALGQA